MLAKELATLDVLSGGRLEIGLGAGWMRTDYEESGIAYDPPAVRVDRFEEGVAVITGLLETDAPFSFEGDHYKVTEHHLLPRPRPASAAAARSSEAAESGCSGSPAARRTS